MMKQGSKVVIIGRTNVGKSTLFNRLSTSVRSMVLDYEGVTRDFISDQVQWKDATFELIDTGGIDFKKGLDFLTEAIRERAIVVLKEADLILFVCDGVVGVTAEDTLLARFVHKLEKPTLLVINKADSKRMADHVDEFHRLGFKHVFEISAQHGLGIAEMLDEIVDLLPEISRALPETHQYKVVLVGKPNVGKSSLMNLLVNKDRSLVADIPGTTREAVSESVLFYKETIKVTDTAGMRRKSSIEEGDIEQLMVKSSLSAVREADIVLLLIDGHEAQLAQQELKLLSYAFEEGKAVILLRNKHDLIDEGIQEQWKFDTSPYEYLLKKVEVLTISCKTGHNIGKILPLVKEVWDRFNIHFSATELTVLFKEGLDRTPLYHQQQRLKLFSAKQIGMRPPLIRMNVNEPMWFGDSQKKFFENLLRNEYNLKGVPVLFAVRKMHFN
jgi:GTP-binding protein